MTNEMTINLSLNEATLQFVNFYAENELDTIEVQTHTLQEFFRKSLYYNKRYDANNALAVGKAISYALNRSEHWHKVKIGLYRNVLVANEDIVDEQGEDIAIIEEVTAPISLPSNDFRNRLIDYLAKRLFDTLKLYLNTQKSDFRNHNVSTQEIRANLYALTESFYKEQKLSYSHFSMGDYVSVDAKQIIELKGKKKNLVFEHMVPNNLYINEFIKLVDNNELTELIIHSSLKQYYYVCLVTEHEAEKLIPFVMGEGWDGQNPFYRYEQAGILYLEQEH